MKSNKPNQQATWRQWPLSITEAASEFIKHISEETRREISGAAESDLITLHQCWGLYLRNNMKIWESYRDHEQTMEHPDWLSYRIIYAAWSKLKQEQTGR